jgi:hypothetical protein
VAISVVLIVRCAGAGSVGASAVRCGAVRCDGVRCGACGAGQLRLRRGGEAI